MTLADATLLAALVAAGGGVLVMWRTNRLQYAKLREEQAQATATATALAAAAATQATDRLVDQLQEERTAIKGSLADAHIKIDRALLRQRYWEDYVNELRNHIEMKYPPPPPVYPPALLRID